MSRAFCLIALIVALAICCGAQTAVTGTVYDLQGAVVPGAFLKFQSKNSLFASSADSDGVYEIEVPPGLYVVSVGGNHFKTLTIKRYRVTQMDSRKMNLDISLEGKTISVLRIK